MHGIYVPLTSLITQGGGALKKMQAHAVQLLHDLLVVGAGCGQGGVHQQLAPYKNTSGCVETS